MKAVRKALAGAGSEAQVVKLDKTTHTAQDAANALNAPLGSIVKTLVFDIGGRDVIVLIAGDKTCAESALPRAFNLEGEVALATAGRVKDVTGCSIGGVSPVGLKNELPIVMDVSLKRFATVYVAAGHPHYVFATNMNELKKLTGGIVSYNITEGDFHHPAKAGAETV
ncbi:MAG: YbaK/EbsC family protein [Rhodospirillales bacterium]|nr:YbaK/EbsC family protein [Rhodospirillales bacterium]